MKILFLEDVEDDVGLISRTLRKNGFEFQAKRVDTQDEFTEALQEFTPDIILSDHSLPQFNSMEALKICKRMGIEIPFILVTGTVSEEFAVNCLKQGADDYILKSNLSRLPSAINNAMQQRELKEQRKKAELELRDQNEELVKINQEMDSFVYSVSHNLRAPLMSVLGLLDLATKKDQERDGYFADYFSMMNHSITKLDETLKEILDYSRNARNEIEFQKIDLRKVIEDCLERVKYLDGFESLEKSITIPSDCPFFSDPYRLTVILNNLISNAIKYRDMTKKKCILAINASINDEAMLLTVEDNGIGINQDMISKVFNMFFRATDRSEGAGLGLYIVKEAINKLRGQITVESEYGKGTKFRIQLPNHTIYTMPVVNEKPK